MLQNRVDPYGEIIRTEARGTIMGNRGVIHDHQQNIVRTFKHKAWITCVLSFKGKHRVVMTPNRWTELFFLDEATAFAAGHRPCCECRREDFKEFKSCWLRGNPQYEWEPKVSIKEIDRIIHVERMDKENYEEVLENIPDGTFIQREGCPFLFAGHSMYAWSPSGYSSGISVKRTEVVKVLTPRSIVNAFNAGYRPDWHKKN